MRGGSSCSSSDQREHALISCAGCDLSLPCTVPQGYCRAFTILFPIFTSSVLPTTANGKWLCGVEGKATLVYRETQLKFTQQTTIKIAHIHAAALLTFHYSKLLQLSHSYMLRTHSYTVLTLLRKERKMCCIYYVT